jgi:ankyrin repeat protein
MFGMDKEPSKKLIKKRAARAKEPGAVHAAVASGDFADVRELIELGANVDESKSSDDATTPLLVAAAKGHADVVKLLLKHGANLYAKDDCDNNPLHVACSKGHVAVVGRLIKSDVDLSLKAGNGATALHLAARKGHDDVVALLLDNDCDIECTDAKGATPLHAACSGGYEDTVALLLKRGANPNACDC